MYPKAIEAVSFVLQGYKTGLLKLVYKITISLSLCHCTTCMYHDFKLLRY